jgi:hypothetical protein
MTQGAKRLSRRNFILAMGAGSAATAAALVAKPPAATSTTEKNKRVSQGYQHSEHVNSYYRTTKV